MDLPEEFGLTFTSMEPDDPLVMTIPSDDQSAVTFQTWSSRAGSDEQLAMHKTDVSKTACPNESP